MRTQKDFYRLICQTLIDWKFLTSKSMCSICKGVVANVRGKRSLSKALFPVVVGGHHSRASREDFLCVSKEIEIHGAAGTDCSSLSPWPHRQEKWVLRVPSRRPTLNRKLSKPLDHNSGVSWLCLITTWDHILRSQLEITTHGHTDHWHDWWQLEMITHRHTDHPCIRFPGDLSRAFEEACRHEETKNLICETQLKAASVCVLIILLFIPGDLTRALKEVRPASRPSSRLISRIQRVLKKSK